MCRCACLWRVACACYAYCACLWHVVAVAAVLAVLTVLKHVVIRAPETTVCAVELLMAQKDTNKAQKDMALAQKDMYKAQLERQAFEFEVVRLSSEKIALEQALTTTEQMKHQPHSVFGQYVSERSQEAEFLTLQAINSASRDLKDWCDLVEWSVVENARETVREEVRKGWNPHADEAKTVQELFIKLVEKLPTTSLLELVDTHASVTRATLYTGDHGANTIKPDLSTFMRGDPEHARNAGFLVELKSHKITPTGGRSYRFSASSIGELVRQLRALLQKGKMRPFAIGVLTDMYNVQLFRVTRGQVHFTYEHQEICRDVPGVFAALLLKDARLELLHGRTL